MGMRASSHSKACSSSEGKKREEKSLLPFSAGTTKEISAEAAKRRAERAGKERESVSRQASALQQPRGAT